MHFYLFFKSEFNFHYLKGIFQDQKIRKVFVNAYEAETLRDIIITLKIEVLSSNDWHLTKHL